VPAGASATGVDASTDLARRIIGDRGVSWSRSLGANVVGVAANQELGRAGEDAVAEWYAHRGFEVVDRNWRVRGGEIDLVAVRLVGPNESLVVFVEVKTRTSSRFGSGADAISAAKLIRMRRTGASWLRAHPSPGRRQVRFDVAAITGHEFHVIAGVC
jgi:putative endonuclease